MTIKNPRPENVALLSPQRDAIEISIHLAGMLEYWNTGLLGLKAEFCLFGIIKIPMYLINLAMFLQPIIPSLHYSR